MGYAQVICLVKLSIFSIHLMIRKKGTRHIILYIQMEIIYLVMGGPNFFQRVDLNGQIPKSVTANILKGYVLEVDLEYSKELRQLHNGYPFVLNKLETKKELLSYHLLKIAGFYNIFLVMLKNWYLRFLIKESMCFIMKV